MESEVIILRIKNVVFVISKFDLVVTNLIIELVTKINLMRLNLSVYENPVFSVFRCTLRRNLISPLIFEIFNTENANVMHNPLAR